MSRTIRNAALITGSGLFLASLAWAGIDTTPEVPTEGASVTITVTDGDGNPVAGAGVEAVYSPGSKVSRTEDVGTTDVNGIVSWTPTGAGIVAVQTETSDGTALTSNLSVRFDGLPLPGLIIFLLAGIILFSGIIRGFRSLDEPPPSLPPDT